LEFSTQFDVIGPVLQICLIDLLLSGDNAILIALACQRLPAELRRKAVLLGTGAAVLFRVLLTLVATLALRAPYLKLVGGVLLLLIAIELLAGSEGAQRPAAPGGPRTDIGRAVAMIVVADLVMSLDNVVAVAAAAQDNLLYLVFGLLLSVPILVFSSLLITRLLASQPLLVEGGAALLGWIAGKTLVADPAIAPALAAQSFGLVALAPLLGAAYVLVQGRLLREQRRHAPGAALVERAAAPALPPPPAPAIARVPAAAVPVPVPVPEPLAAPAAAPAAPMPPVPAAPAPLDARRAAGPAAETAAPASADAAGAAPAQAGGKRFSAMDYTIMAGVAVPALGLVATLIYIIGKAIGSR
jgi:YjbE family integral membrane protein